jgi:hypothetical protein
MVPIFMLLIGSIFGASWRDAVFGRNDCATVVFMFFLIMMGYLPANNQITLVPDHLFALLAWIYFWRRTRRPVAEMDPHGVSAPPDGVHPSQTQPAVAETPLG